MTLLDGKPIMSAGGPMKLREACSNALLSTAQNQTQNPSNKYRDYVFAKKVVEATDETDFSIDEVADLKKAIGETQPKIIVGRAYDMLESSTK